MIHNMRLNDEPFQLIKNGIKTIELRLNDEKRQLINVGDIIVFENRITLERQKVEVLNLYKYNNFEELYRHFDKSILGYSSNAKANSKDMEKYYSLEEQEKYGVIGIEVQVIN